ncbi:hypothetical protein CQ047_08555 [Microbacterium sp. MYb72]|uniref:ribosomal protein L7/L12 n=1 Tax=Microbacterium sp. MYb72 TaxID=1848693 RepID=UPI000D41560A|nr:ribosomal protein L7/L12 [Microbacterium sp. MYb72]PRB09986.1 hypothetical protein CQ047_08555 [Microbacterium sp. MYb72]
MDSIIVVIVVAAVVVVGIVIVAAALRGMRPKEPEAQVYRPSPTTARTAPATSSMSPTSGLTPRVVADIDRLVASDQKIQAIKLYRQSTGVGLKEAKDRIDHWSISTTAPHAAAVSHANAARTSITPSSIRASLPAPVAADIDRLVAEGAKITAIKALREHTGVGLKEAKDAIEAWTPGR